jgi:hypothetical protein
MFEGRGVLPGLARARWILPAAIVVMTGLALLKLGSEFWRLVFSPYQNGAIDLRFYYNWTQAWFVGGAIYDGPSPAEYPPASFVILWPAFGWLTFGAARWLWAASLIPMMMWSGRLLVRGSLADTPVERWFVFLMLLSINATGVTIGNGQLVLHLLPMLIAPLLLIASGTGRLADDLLAAALLAVALVKPSVSAPFLLMAALVPGRVRPLLVAGAAYLGLTLFAVSFQHAGVWSLLGRTVSNATAEAARGGYGNLHNWLAATGFSAWLLPASAIVFGLLGVWIARHRRADQWLLLSVTAIVARLWTYHRLYDDVLIIVPMVCLFRIAKRDGIEQPVGVIARVLLGATLLLMWLPARLSWAPFPWNLPFIAGHPIVWLATLGLLLLPATERALRPASLWFHEEPK